MKKFPRINLSSRQRFAVTAVTLGLMTAWTVSSFINKPYWTSQYSYQFVQPAALSDSVDNGQGNASFFVRNNAVGTQISILQSEKLLGLVNRELRRQGNKTWTVAALRKAIEIKNPLQSEIIQIEVKTPHQQDTRQIAKALHQVYLSYLDELHQDLTRDQITLVNRQIRAKRKELIAQNDLIQQVAPVALPADMSELADIGQESPMVKLSQINNQISDVELQIAAEEAKYEHLNTLLAQQDAAEPKKLADADLAAMTAAIAQRHVDAFSKSANYHPAVNYKLNKDGAIAVEAKEQAAKPARLITPHTIVVQDFNAKPQKPVQDLAHELNTASLNLKAAQAKRQKLAEAKTALLQNMNQGSKATNSATRLHELVSKQTLAEQSLAALENKRSQLQEQLNLPSVNIRLLDPIPSKPRQDKNHSLDLMVFLGSLACSFSFLAAMPAVSKKVRQQIQQESIAGLIERLSKLNKQSVVLVLPVNQADYMNISPNLAGLLNTLGNDTLVMDVDLFRRKLTLNNQITHPYGMLRHLINPEMNLPYQDITSNAKVVPVEAALQSHQNAEYGEIIKRVPQLFKLWKESTILLDAAAWHPAYENLLPHLSEIVFYSPSQVKSAAVLPRIFKQKYNIPVTLLKI